MYDYFLFDCDGVLWIGSQTIEGSFDALKELRQLGKPYYLITNASQRSRQQVVQKCVEEHDFHEVMSAKFTHLATSLPFT